MEKLIKILSLTQATSKYKSSNSLRTQQLSPVEKMNIYSAKYTIRSLFRDILRGWWARNIVYPRILENERNEWALNKYVKKQQIRINLDTQQSSTPYYINKETVRNSPKSFIRPRTLSSFIRSKISTSGSTGRPLTLLQDLRAIVLEEAFVYRQLRWTGYSYGERRAWLRGDIVYSGNNNRETFGCRDWWSNTLMLSSYHISQSTAENYISSLSKFDPIIIQAYPSSINALATWMLSKNKDYKGKSLRAIVTSSETLDREMRERIEKAFGCKVFDWYGQAERVIAIGTCDHGSYHILNDYGMVELIPEENDTYELVGTSYNNLTMPLPHYRTGDFIRLSQAPCSCGRIFPVATEIIGRRDKVITLPDGREIGRLDHVFKGVNNILEGQIVYQGKAHFLLKIVAISEWKHTDSELLIKNLNDRISDVTANIEIVDSISRAANGKFNFIRIEAEE